MRTLDDIKEDIHTINPDINEKTLNLLYEYIMLRYSEFLEKINRDK